MQKGTAEGGDVTNRLCTGTIPSDAIWNGRLHAGNWHAR